MFDKTIEAAIWARPAHSGSGVVVALPHPLPLGVASELAAAGLRAVKFFPLNNFVAVLFTGEIVLDLLELIPPPPSHGSRTAGNLLPR